MRRIIIIVYVLLALPLFAETVYQDFDDINVFKTNKAAKATMKLHKIKGYKGKAVRIDYDVTKGHFVEIFFKTDIDLKKINDFSWRWRGDAKGNIIEFKFVDGDGTTFGTKLLISGIKKDKWTEYTLPVKYFHYMWGGDKKVDEIKTLYIAISRGKPRKGYIELDDLRYTKRKEGEPAYEIHLNQVGYHPNDKKFFVLRMFDVPYDEKVKGSFVVKDKFSNKEVYKGKLKDTKFKDWKGRFFKGEFNKVNRAGSYFIQAKISIDGNSFLKNSYSFKIGDKVISEKTLPLELTYLKYQHCGVKCHKKDPVDGGYHDTLFDISKRMWSLPGLIYGMALYNRYGVYHPDNNKDGELDDLKELLWGFRFLSQMPDKDGAVSWGGIEADFSKYMTHEEFINRLGSLKPEDDHLPRIKYKDQNILSTGFNLIALIKSIPVMKKLDKKSVKLAEKNALKAFGWLEKQKLKSANEYGFYIWAATELYYYTKNKKFLKNTDTYVQKLLALQALNFNKFERNTCGDFYTSAGEKEFIFQYKYVYMNIAINMGLINLCNILPQDDPLWFDVYYACRVFGENYLKGIASKTPYLQAAHGLELSGNKKKTRSDGEKWRLEVNENSSADKKIIKSAGDIIINILFKIGKGNWIQVAKPVKSDMKELKKIQLKYKYNGKPNSFEVKLTDKDGSTFGHTITVKKSNKWQKFVFDISKMKYRWGGNKKLNRKALDSFWMAISKGQGGNGNISVKDIEFIMKDGDVEKMFIGNDDEDQKFVLNYFAGEEASRAAAQNHGLNCDHLSLGYVALKWGQYIGDLELEEFADNQLNWVLGTNPLDYCMLLGAGVNNPVVMAEYFDKPRVDGIIPNGIVGGDKGEPSWWGDGPSSGEDWLPHNSAWFMLMSEIDTPAEIKGKILLNGKKVTKAKVEIFDNNKSIKKTFSNKKGYFLLENISPQKEYKIVIKKGKRVIKDKIKLLSGSKINRVWDFKRDLKIKIIQPKKIESGKNNVFTVKLPGKAKGMKYRVRVKGAITNDEITGKVKNLTIKLNLVPEGCKPLLLRFELEGKPVVYKEVYYKSL